MTKRKVLRNHERVRVPTKFKGKTMTEQHHEKSCNINNILARYQNTGLIDHVREYEGTYGDVTGADFKEAQDLITNEKSVFMELPAAVRAKFDNDPANYLDLVMTDEGIQELGQMLTEAKPTAAPKEGENQPEQAELQVDE